MCFCVYCYNENLWFFICIMCVLSGEISVLCYKGKMVLLVSLSVLKNSMQGEVLLIVIGFLICNIDFFLLLKMILVMGVNGVWYFVDWLYFLFYIIVDMEFFDKKLDIICVIVSQLDILLFIIMYGIVKIVDCYGDVLCCCLVLIEDGCYKIYQLKVVSEVIKCIYQQNVVMCFYFQCLDICFSIDICQGIFDVGMVVYWVL